ncbi:MAG: class I SAM-dependent methyltransferase [Candidatus Woesearchaeota archaeon]
MGETRDVATVFNDAYSRTAPVILGDQHRFLLATLDTFLAQREDPVLVVLGSGGQVLPYSCSYTNEGNLGYSNRDRMIGMIRRGKIVLVDYVLEKARFGLDKGCETLSNLGFFSDNYFFEGEFIDTLVDPNTLGKSTVNFLLNNLKDDLRIADESVDAVDANLSIHHASVTRAELERVYKEIYRILKPGGLLHLGEGNVDMNYSEDKLISFGRIITDHLGLPMLLVDEREKDNGYVMSFYFEPGTSIGDIDGIPVIADGFELDQNYLESRVDRNGLIFIYAGNERKRVLSKDQFRGLVNRLVTQEDYGQILTFEDCLAVPLIDNQRGEDVERHLTGVNAFYDAIFSRAKAGYELSDPDLFAQNVSAIDFERGNSLRGIVEFYMGESNIVRTLKNVGFFDIQPCHHKTEPFYNITARKPE